MFQAINRSFIRVLAAGTVGTSYVHLTSTRSHNLEKEKKDLPNTIKDFEGDIYGVAQYAANSPIEDRYCVDQLSLGGWWFSVFDGHGGWQCSDYSHKRLHKNFAVELANHLGITHEENKQMGFEIAGAYEGSIDEKLVTRALIQSFERTDRQYMTKVYGAFELGFGRDTRAGSCAIGSVIIDNVLFVANAGDSRAVLGVNRNAYEKQMIKPRKSMSKATIDQVQQDNSLLLGLNLGDAAYRESTGETLDPEVKAALREKMLEKIYEERKKRSYDASEAEIEDIDTLNTMIPKGTKQVVDLEVQEEKDDKQASSYSNPLVTIGRMLTGSSNSSEEEELDLTPFRAIDLSFDHNCREPREKKLLEREHPGEKDVYICKRGNDLCYVKGKLQPTRAFGDFYLKHSEFMCKPEDPSSAGRYIKPPYTPPYIKATPEVAVRHLNQGIDEFLIIGSDGLWDQMSSEEAVDFCGKVLRSPNGTPQKASEALIEEALSRAAVKNGLTLDQMKQLPPGRSRRRLHDDISIVVVDIARLLNMHYWG